MTALREELARAINKTRPPTCDHPQCSCMYECERHDDMADSYLDAVDAILPILTREIAAARKAALEEAAGLCDAALGDAHPSELAAAIRKLKDSS